MSSVAIITARGGSKRIPRKNIKEFCGKPIIAYSIEAALKSELFDEVMVSTDDAEIAEVARKYGAQVPFMRSAKNSDDYATTEDVLEEVITTYSNNGKDFECFSCIYPTAPFVTAEKLQKSYEVFSLSGAGTLEAVVKFSYPPQRGYIRKDGFLQYKYPQYINSRSQDLEPFFHDAGQFYYFNTIQFLQARKKGIELKKVPFLLDEIEVQDIDTLMDWKIAEVKYSLMLEKLL